MNDKIPIALSQFVEQMLAAVPAGAGRRAQMREELLAHLLAVFADEFERLQNEEAAASAAMRRFGHAADVGGELKKVVPWFEQTKFHIFGRKGCLMKWLFVFLGVVGVLVGAGFICPAVAELLTAAGVLENTGLHHYSHWYMNVLSITLLIFGSLLSLAGVWSVAHGVKKFRVTAS